MIQLSLASVSADSASRRLPGERFSAELTETLNSQLNAGKTDQPLLVETLTALVEGFYDGLYLRNPVFRIQKSP